MVRARRVSSGCQRREPAWTALSKLRNDIFALKPANDLAQTIKDKAIDKVQDIYDSRRTRVADSG